MNSELCDTLEVELYSQLCLNLSSGTNSELNLIK